MLIIGRIYSNGCPHCIAMQKEWDLLKSLVSKNKRVKVEDIEASDNQEGNISRVNKVYGVKGSLLHVVEGYPTIFKIVNHRVHYFEGERTAKSILFWAMGKKGEKGHLKGGGLFNFLFGKKQQDPSQEQNKPSEYQPSNVQPQEENKPSKYQPSQKPGLLPIVPSSSASEPTPKNDSDKKPWWNIMVGKKEATNGTEIKGGKSRRFRRKLHKKTRKGYKTKM